MRGDLPEQMENIWRSGNYIGKQRAFARVTVQHPQMRLETFNMQSTFRRVPTVSTDVASFNPYPSGVDPTRGEEVTNTYADFLFSAPEPPKELPNVASVAWSRTTDTDAASATIAFWNTAPMPLGESPHMGDLDRPGWYTATRGSASFSSRWKHLPNEWQNMLMPDNILRTYEGYGFDADVPPEQDPNLVITGVWLIDEVRLDAFGRLVCSCRDTMRLLMDHQAFLPVVPEDFYPPTFRDWSEKVTVQTKRNVITESNNTERLPIAPMGSGNDRWPESAYTGARVYGHSHTHAFDGNPETYWLSVGNDNPNYRSSYEYIEFNCNGANVTSIQLQTVRAGYTAYLSVETSGGWIPGPELGYRRDGRGRYDEGIPYVASMPISSEGVHTFHVQLQGARRVRIWFNNVQNFGLAGSKFRVGVREISAYGPVHRREVREVIDVNQVNLTPGPTGSNPGMTQDFTDIVKLFAAWAGLYWPSDAYQFHSDGTQHHLAPTKPDFDTLGQGVLGRVWGDLQETGTAPPNQILASAFDKKSLMDGVRYIADVVGFLAYADETGALQWRLPNVWSLGNWIGGMAAAPGRTNRLWTIDERQVLLGLDATIQSRNVREGVFVGNAVGRYAAMVGGYNPNPTGLRRVAGYTDQNFNSIAEARVMADLIAVRQLFRYREDAVRIPAFPGIQIDDQVRIFERVTSEGFVHYVKGISSSNDLATGEWTYDLQTHWLGDDPEGQWVFDKASLESTTISYVDALRSGVEWSRSGLGA